MASIKIMQGDEYDIYIKLRQDGVTLAPEIVEDVEVCVGTDIRKTYKSGSVAFDNQEKKWYIRLTQQETFSMEEGQHQVFARVKYNGTPLSDVVGIKLDNIVVSNTESTYTL